MRACFKKDESGSIALDMEIVNNSGQQLSDFDLVFNKNAFGVAI